MSIFILVGLLVLAVAIIILVYIQSGKVKSAGSSIVGTENLELFRNKKTRGTEKVIAWVTSASILLFFILAIVARASFA